MTEPNRNLNLLKETALFTRNDNEDIIRLVEELNHDYGEVSKRMNLKFTPKQIRQRWINHLDPTLCLDPFDEKHKLFIIQWVTNKNNHRTLKNGDDVIPWINLINKMIEEFDKKFPENKVKNFWNLTLKGKKVNPKEREIDTSSLNCLSMACTLTSWDKLCIACDDAYEKLERDYQ